MSLDTAIVTLEADVAAYRPGTSQAPKERTADWWRLRALSLGLSCLKQMRQLKVEEDAAAAERFYRACSKNFKNMAVPPEELVEREVPPA